MPPVQYAKYPQAAEMYRIFEITIGEFGVADAESERVIVWHERRRETEIAKKVIRVVRW